jgi:predicted Fe-Mo cluster-binding NifX family protein
MRMLVSANGPDWDATIAPLFETAPYYLLVDTDAETCHPYTCDDLQPLATLQVQAVITGRMATESMRCAVEAGIHLYTIPAGGIRIAVDQCLRGKLKPIAPSPSANTTPAMR